MGRYIFFLGFVVLVLNLVMPTIQKYMDSAENPNRQISSLDVVYSKMK